MLEQFKDYYKKANMMQELKFQGIHYEESDIDDDLVWNVPIYDVVNRRYAAFSSLLEAIIKKDKDPKGNGKYFDKCLENMDSDFDMFYLCYLFRLCGSGINYKPKSSDIPFGTHGFGNFWIVNLLVDGKCNYSSWLENIPEKGFCDVKGYLLPMIKGGLRNFILSESNGLVEHLFNYVMNSSVKIDIKSIVDTGNKYLRERGFKRQNFVLTAFAMDLAEYFDEVDESSDVYVGSNAKKCLKMILPKMKHDDALRYLCDITGGKSNPMDMEDVACDFIRYIENFQSKEHVDFNNGKKYKNNVCK